jgi:hypothetical protein
VPKKQASFQLGPLYDPTAEVERIIEGTGTVLRLRLFPLGKGRVRIEEYYRKRSHETRFSRISTEEGLKLAFTQLRLDKPYDEVFTSPAAQALAKAKADG